MTKKPAKPDGITFLATIPDIKSAFQADADEVRIMFSVPKAYRAEAMRLAGMFNRVLEVGVLEH